MTSAGPVGRLAPGARNAITDVPGVRVGHAQAASGQRTGVTVVEPPALPARAGTAVVNGVGELTAKLEIDERGRDARRPSTCAARTPSAPSTRRRCSPRGAGPRTS